MNMGNIIEGSVRYTRNGYRCRNCGFNFFFDFTSPAFQCPKCGRIINDKGAYYLSRILRALGIAFAILLILTIPAAVIMKDTWVMLPASIVALAIFLVLLYQQVWSLVLTRVMYRAFLVFAVVALVIALPVFVLQAMKWYQPEGPVLAGAIAVVSLVVTIVSLLLFKVNAKTYDYENKGAISFR